jgi:hypothetical protein
MSRSDAPDTKAPLERNSDAVITQRQWKREQMRDTVLAIDVAHQGMHRLRLRESSTRREALVQLAAPLVSCHPLEFWPSQPAERYHAAYNRIVKARTAIAFGDDGCAKREAQAVRAALAGDPNRDAQRLTRYATEVFRDVGGDFDYVDVLCIRTRDAACKARDYVGIVMALVTHANLIRMKETHRDGDIAKVHEYLRLAKLYIKGPGYRMSREVKDILLHQIALQEARVHLYNGKGADAATPAMEEMRGLAGERHSPTWLDTVRDDAGYWILKGNYQRAHDCMKAFREALDGVTLSRHARIAVQRAEIELAIVTDGDLEGAFGTYVSLIDACPSAHHLNQLASIAKKIHEVVPHHLRAAPTRPCVPALAYVYHQSSILERS